MNDPIIDEIRRIRDEHAAAFNYDIQAIYNDLKKRQVESGRTFVSYPPRLIEPKAFDTESGETILSSSVANGAER